MTGLPEPLSARVETACRAHDHATSDAERAVIRRQLEAAHQDVAADAVIKAALAQPALRTHGARGLFGKLG